MLSVVAIILSAASLIAAIVAIVVALRTKDEVDAGGYSYKELKTRIKYLEEKTGHTAVRRYATGNMEIGEASGTRKLETAEDFLAYVRKD